MNARARTLAGTSALALGLGLAGTTGTAYAKPKPPDPTTTGCTYAGLSYSEGSGRQQKVTRRNGETVYADFTCQNGEWVLRGYSRTKDPAQDDATKRPGTPPRR